MSKDFLKPITVTLLYDKKIRRITGKRSEPAVVNEGMPFILMLSFIFKSYPEIEKRYPPGTLGLKVNGKPPQDFDILSDGDKVELLGF